MRTELEQRVLDCAANVHAAHAALADALAAFERSGEWQGAGIRSIGHWADINLGVPSRDARRLAAAAARLPELPELQAAFAEGAVSLDKVLLVTPVATPRLDAHLTAIARAGSVAQVARICATYRDVTKNETPEAAEQRHARRGVTASETDDGLIRIVALLEPDEAALVLATLDARVEAAWRAGRPADDDTPAPNLAARRADALVDVSTERLADGPHPVVRGEHIEVRVIVDAHILDGTAEGGICAIDGVGPVPRTTVERLLCDCKVSYATLRPDGALDVGRTQRTPNRRQRRALEFRDKGCRFYGCPNRRYVQAHHVVLWDHGGPTDLDNLILLCPEHHRLFHEGGYTIDALGNGQFTFRQADGRVIEPPPLHARPDATPPAPGDPRAQDAGHRYDLGLTIDALLSA